MTHLDSRGLPLSTTSEIAAEYSGRAWISFSPPGPARIRLSKKAIAADPDFALAHAARARLHAIRVEAPAARERIAIAADIVARHGTESERSHVDIVSLAVHAKTAKALERVLVYADKWPRDVVILGLPLGAFGLFAFSGIGGSQPGAG